MLLFVLRALALSDIAKDQYHPTDLPGTLSDGSRTIINGAFGTALGDQHRVISQPNDSILSHDLGDRTLDRVACGIKHNPENLRQHLSARVLLLPTGQ